VNTRVTIANHKIVTFPKENGLEKLDDSDDLESTISHDYKMKMDIATEFIRLIIPKISNFIFNLPI